MKRINLFMALAIIACGCNKNPTTISSREIVYVESNNFMDNQNSILAYEHTQSGTFVPITGSPFLTSGAGVANPHQDLGPDDSDTQLKMSEDGKFLFAVNSGSNTIAVFSIQNDGSLTAVPGSPFPSGGQTPVSIDVKGQYVYVVNKSDDPIHPITQNPNYVVFTVDAAGKLTLISSSKIETTPGSSPAQALVSKDGKFLFGADFLGFKLTPLVGTLRSFTINSSGLITPVPGTPQYIPGMGGALGLWQHPSSNTLYVGFPLQGKFAIYNINSTSGSLNFISTVDAGPAACWIRTSKSGNRLYVLNSGENSISMYNSSSPQAPTSLGKIMLKNSGPIYMAMGLPFTTSEGFAFEFSASEKNLYVVSQHTNPDFNIGNYNYLHALTVADDGTLSEPNGPLQLPVTSNIRPQGVVVYNTK